jgi:hypothetical protein
MRDTLLLEEITVQIDISIRKLLTIGILWMIIWSLTVMPSNGTAVPWTSPIMEIETHTSDTERINKEPSFGLSILVGTISNLTQVENPTGDTCWFFEPVNLLWIWIVYYDGKLQKFYIQVLHKDDLLPFLLIDEYFHGIIIQHFICGFSVGY